MIAIERTPADMRLRIADAGSAACVDVEWTDSARAVWLSGCCGMSVHALRALLLELRREGVETAMTRRGTDCALPCGVRGDDGITRIDVQAAAHRLASPLAG